MAALLVTVRSLTGLYHGRGDGGAPEWPPSPFRLFQATVAGACAGRWRDEESGRDDALGWLERQAPPEIHAPPITIRNAFELYVPNNDLDAKGGDPARLDKIRTARTLVPLAFDPDLPVHYLWRRLDSDVPAALVPLVHRLHTLGLGIDPAFADARVLSDEEGAAFRPVFPSRRYRPGAHAGTARRPSRAGVALPVPVAGSLMALHARHAGFVDRLRPYGRGKTAFVQPPKPVSGRIDYAAPPADLVLELRDVGNAGRFEPALSTASEAIVVALRDIVAGRFVDPDTAEAVERYVHGRTAGPDDIADRVRFVPLPSIGGPHADHRIRRVLVEVPQGSPVRAESIRWALEGQLLGPNVLAGDTRRRTISPDEARAAGPSGAALLTVGGGRDAVVSRYRPRGGARRWRSVTPVVLPRSARGPRRASGTARARAGADAERALRQALRHAGIDVPLLDARFRREPFSRHGSIAAHAADSRFEPRRLSHVELTLAAPVQGPLLLGDGRFCGLGLFEPVGTPSLGRWRLRFGEGVPGDRYEVLLRQLRRALMAQVQRVVGDGVPLPAFVSGHASDGAPLRGGTHEHLFLRAEREGELAVGAEICLPGAVNRSPTDRPVERFRTADARLIDEALSGLHRLHVERVDLAVNREPVPPPIAATRLRSRTPYVTTRRPRAADERHAFVEADLRAQIARTRLPSASRVEILSCSLRPDGLLVAEIELRFERAVFEPVLLGRTAHLGGGDFRPHDPEAP